MFRKIQHTLVTLLAVVTFTLTGSTSLYATDISNALIYNTERFTSISNVNVTIMVQTFVHVYVYENCAYKRLTLYDDYNYTVTDANGEECLFFDPGVYGEYLLTITGIGNYTGTASQTWYRVVGGGNWNNYKAESFSNIDNDNHIITIMNEAEFALLSYVFNSVSYSGYSGWTIRLDCDLDMSAHYFNPIGCPDRPGDEASFGGHTMWPFRWHHWRT